MTVELRHTSLALVSLLLAVGAVACSDDATDGDSGTESETAGDGDPSGDGDGDGDPSGDGDGDPSGDGDGDPSGDGDGDPSGDGDGDPSGDGDGDPSGDGDGDPVEPYCGDGNVDAGEDCDDANADNTDDCLDSCVAASCGDGYVWAGNEACDDANADNTDDCLDSCAAPSCGDGFVWAGNEDCDDANMQANDGCEDDCTVTAGALKFTTGENHTCALSWAGQVKCWGLNSDGQLGYGNTDNIGDNELPSSIGWVDLGATAVDIEAGGAHTCALLDDASVMCWGKASLGQLGYGNTDRIGDDELPSSVGVVDVGDDIVDLELGLDWSCALTDQATVRCWGYGRRLGYGNIDNIGDDEAPSSAGTVSLGGDVIDFSASREHTCALLDNDAGVRCWGFNGYGQLGLGHTDSIGDDELPSSINVIQLGNTPVVDVSAGWGYTCVLYDNQTIRCWGFNTVGTLGYGHSTWIGDNELPMTQPTVNVGAPVDEVSTSFQNTCVRSGTNIKCWGGGSWGANGNLNTSNIGDNETPAGLAWINVGMNVTALAGGTNAWHICAQGGSELRCWGRNNSGELGLGYAQHIGDDETPASVGPISFD